MNTKTANSTPKTPSWGWPEIFTGLIGWWLGLGLLKFGNPIILDRMVEPPGNLLETLFQPWPILWGYAGVILLAAIGLLFVRPRLSLKHWVIWLPAVWLGWQWISSARSVAPDLSRITLHHFCVCAGMFYLGLLVLSRAESMRLFWWGILAGFAYALWVGLDQHYGGLEATRRAFYENTPNWQSYPPEFLQKIQSNRIFSTLVYPNALAGAILLLLFPTLTVLWRTSENWPRILRGVALGCLVYASLACLYWTESRSGWLIALFLGVVLMFHQPWPLKNKLMIAGAFCLIGLVAFTLRNQAYFKRGATSVSARGDYWKAAAQTFRERPIFGAGPGTFVKSYAKVKPPEAEMTRLVHNDYLEQASDSGLLGFVTYTAFWAGSLLLLSRRANTHPLRMAIWLGLLGWGTQSLVEFGLYIPATAWPAFALTGWLWGTDRNGIDTAAS